MLPNTTFARAFGTCVILVPVLAPYHCDKDLGFLPTYYLIILSICCFKTVIYFPSGLVLKINKT